MHRIVAPQARTRVWERAGYLALFACLLPRVALADPPSSASVRAQLDGLKTGKVPPSVYAQVPKLPDGKGILVLEISPGSFAAQVGLKRYDILLTLGGKDLPSDASPGALTLPLSTKDVPVVLFRGGEAMTLHVAPVRLFAVTGPALPKAMPRPGEAPTVSVDAKPLEGNRLKVTFTYSANGSSKFERVNCSGSVDEIKLQVKDLGEQKRMPQQIQDLADVVLERLRVLNSEPKKK